ncbi:MAG: hypothetical protein ACYC23_20440, partial [Limisphaerales bacterium]
CSPLPHPWGVHPEHITCTVTQYWALEVDLDGDGNADLTRERFRAENLYTHYNEAGQFTASYQQQDEIEAYYPTAGTEVYVQLTDPDGWYHWEARVTAGQLIEPEPSTAKLPYWTWTIPKGIRPRFEAEGLGIIDRREDHYPCESINCSIGRYAGWMRSPEAWPFESDYYFGVRLLKVDGWHLGWIRLEWKSVSPYPVLDPVTLVSSAIHPEPGMPIRPGEAAQPTLRAQRDGDSVVVSWASAWEGFVLERSATMNGGTWTAVPGVSGNTVRLPASEAPAFLRLRQNP